MEKHDLPDWDEITTFLREMEWHSVEFTDLRETSSMGYAVA